MTYRLYAFPAALSLLFMVVVNADNFCTVTKFEEVANAAKNCDILIMKDLLIPAYTTLQIDLKLGAKLLFDGTITHEVRQWTGDLIYITGNNVSVSGTENHLIDGLGPQHWRGGNESSILRPKFVRITLTNSTFSDLKLKNCPNNCITISNSSNLLVTNIDIDNYDGYPGVAPQESYAKNTDGFDVDGTHNLRIENSHIINQDDCVAVNSGSNMVIENLYCNGSHGLSFSVTEGVVSDVLYLNSRIVSSDNAIHIKTHNDGGNGLIRNIKYENIEFVDIFKYAVSVQENYPRGQARANVPIKNLTLENVTGTMKGKKSRALSIICAIGGCEDWHFDNFDAQGAYLANECQQVPNGILC